MQSSRRSQKSSVSYRARQVGSPPALHSNSLVTLIPATCSALNEIEATLTKTHLTVGTGKTFVGVLISKILIKNQSLRQKLPVMFICQTNHALDQMLEHIYKFDQVIICVHDRHLEASTF